jgi:hypothetical protein
MCGIVRLAYKVLEVVIIDLYFTKNKWRNINKC